MELNEETRFILGRPNFWCGQIAHILRQKGHSIIFKAEEEQAYVIHFMIDLYEQHGAGWRAHFEAYFKGA